MTASPQLEHVQPGPQPLPRRERLGRGLVVQPARAPAAGEHGTHLGVGQPGRHDEVGTVPQGRDQRGPGLGDARASPARWCPGRRPPSQRRSRRTRSETPPLAAGALRSVDRAGGRRRRGRRQQAVALQPRQQVRRLDAAEPRDGDPALGDHHVLPGARGLDPLPELCAQRADRDVHAATVPNPPAHGGGCGRSRPGCVSGVESDLRQGVAGGLRVDARRLQQVDDERAVQQHEALHLPVARGQRERVQRARRPRAAASARAPGPGPRRAPPASSSVAARGRLDLLGDRRSVSCVCASTAARQRRASTRALRIARSTSTASAASPASSVAVLADGRATRGPARRRCVAVSDHSSSAGCDARPRTRASSTSAVDPVRRPRARMRSTPARSSVAARGQRPGVPTRVARGQQRDRERDRAPDRGVDPPPERPPGRGDRRQADDDERLDARLRGEHLRRGR